VRPATPTSCSPCHGGVLTRVQSIRLTGGRAPQRRRGPRLAFIGVATTTSSPRHPQTCGKKEREWSSLQQWLRARPPAHSKDELTKMVEAYEAIFNTSRPHQSLDGATPASVYQATAKAEPGPGGPQSRRFLHDVRASSRGYVDIARTRIRLGSDWAGADLTYLADLGHVVLFHGNDIIAKVELDREAGLGQPHTTRAEVHAPPDQPGPAAAPRRRSPEPVKAGRQDTRRAPALTGSKTVPRSADGPRSTVEP